VKKIIIHIFFRGQELVDEIDDETNKGNGKGEGRLMVVNKFKRYEKTSSSSMYAWGNLS
jgi:hypothetical protein